MLCRNPRKSPANRPKKVSIIDAFNDKHKRPGLVFSHPGSAQGSFHCLLHHSWTGLSALGVLVCPYMLTIFNFCFCFVLPDLRHLNLAREKEDASSLGGFEAHHDQPPDLATACSSSRRARFHWRKVFRLWRKRSIKHQLSFPPFCLPNITKPKSKSMRENPVLCNLYNFRSSLVNFSLSDLRIATNNFSNGM